MGGVEHGGGPGPVGGVAGPAHAVDLGGDVVGPVLLDVHAEDLRPLLGQGVGGLAADALAGADDHEALAVQAEQVGVVRNSGVIGTRHGADHGRSGAAPPKAARHRGPAPARHADPLPNPAQRSGSQPLGCARFGGSPDTVRR